MNNARNQLPPAARKLAEHGNLIAAIKMVRETHGLGLAEAKAVVEAYLRNAGPRAAAEAGEDPELPGDAVAILQEGDLIGAIRRTREATGKGLKDSKEAVEQYLAANPLVHEQFRDAARRRRGPWRGLFWFVVVLVGVWLVVRALRGG